MRSFLIRCYPAGWRDRYGDEFAALLEERPLGPFDVADVLLGALDARLRLRRQGGAQQRGRSVIMSLRIGGFAAIAGAALLAAAGVSGSGLVSVGSTIPPVLLIGGLTALLVALAGLSAFQARAHPLLVWGAFAMAAIGTLVAIIGSFVTSILGDAYWAFGIGGLLMALTGSALFAVATYRTAVLSRGGAVLVGMGSILPFVGMNVPLVYLVSVICFLLGWFTLGAKAIRLDRPATEPRPA
jgi:hypothetical protein